MSNGIKKFFFQLIIFIILVVIGQSVVAIFITPYYPERLLLDKYSREKRQIIYFGDSVIKYISPNDKDKSSIVEMLSKINPAYTIGDISHGGYYLKIEEELFKYILKSPNKPEAVILPINLHLLSTAIKGPGFQFEKEIFYLRMPRIVTYFYKPLAIFKAININTVKYSDYSQTPVYYGKEKIGVAGDFDNSAINSLTTENIRKLYIFTFMQSLDKNNEQFKSLNNIIDLANKANIKLYVYLTPINFEGGKKYVGPDFIKQTTANAKVVCQILKEKNLPCLNLAFSLNSDYFVSTKYPNERVNEHINEKGRKFIAEQITKFFLNKP